MSTFGETTGASTVNLGAGASLATGGPFPSGGGTATQVSVEFGSTSPAVTIRGGLYTSSVATLDINGADLLYDLGTYALAGGAESVVWSSISVSIPASINLYLIIKCNETGANRPDPLYTTSPSGDWDEIWYGATSDDDATVSWTSAGDDPMNFTETVNNTWAMRSLVTYDANGMLQQFGQMGGGIGSNRYSLSMTGGMRG